MSSGPRRGGPGTTPTRSAPWPPAWIVPSSTTSPRSAGDRTWVGPTAARLEQAVRTARHEFDGAAADLRREASLLDHEATDLERAAARTQLAPVP